MQLPSRPPSPAAEALALARAILGSAAKIVGANLHGNAAASGLDGDAARLSVGPPGDGQVATTYLDVSFIADDDALDLDIRLDLDAAPEPDEPLPLREGVSIWMNGRAVPQSVGGTPPGGMAPKAPIPVDAAGALSLAMQARIGIARGAVNTLRIATGRLGLGLLGAALTIRAAQAGKNDNFRAGDDSYTTTINTAFTFDPRTNDVGPGQSGIFVTHINGQEIDVGVTVTLETGETVTLNEDGTLTIQTDGVTGTTQFTYTAAYGVGNARPTDVATITIDTVPCFRSGTMIRTDRGDMPVERLRVGQAVATRDDGLQPIRWIGRRTLQAEGPMAPIRIAAGTFGDHGTLMVSPQHRVLVRHAQADLLFGSSEVLLAAKDLVDGKRVTRVEGGLVEYVHILFDRHQIVWSEGVETESFLPGPQTTDCFERDVIAEIARIFPELDPVTGEGYGDAARPTLRSYEARLLVA